jgi:NAD(P)-dependent dehydrogenase (short-subunit alcohol dehydrogenase family)
MNIFLTGGNRGIGEHIKKIFQENSHTVLSPTRQELELSSLDNVSSYLNDCDFDADIVINNAGINVVEDLSNFKVETFNNVMNVNFLSHVLITNKFIDKAILNNKKLFILNIGSIRIDKLKKGRIHYTISKSCLDILTRYIVQEHSDKNIYCNTISPGYVETDMLYQNNSDDKIKEMLNQVPLKTFANPEEIAKLAYYLCVNNSYINGQNINIDGGITCL